MFSLRPTHPLVFNRTPGQEAISQEKYSLASLFSQILCQTWSCRQFKKRWAIQHHCGYSCPPKQIRRICPKCSNTGSVCQKVAEPQVSIVDNVAVSRYPGWFDSFFAWEVPRHSSKEYSAGAQQGARRVWPPFRDPRIYGYMKPMLSVDPRVPVIQKLDDGRLFHQRTAEFVDPIIRSGAPK